MAQDWTEKKKNFVQRFSDAWVGFLAYSNQLEELCTEFTADGYGVGGQNALADADVQSVLPAATALLVAEAEGVFIGAGGIQSIITTNAGYIEMMRP